MSSYYSELLSSVKILVWCAVRCICRFMKGGGALLLCGAEGYLACLIFLRQF
jgi:hypothetical protein